MSPPDVPKATACPPPPGLSPVSPPAATSRRHRHRHRHPPPWGQRHRPGAIATPRPWAIPTLAFFHPNREGGVARPGGVGVAWAYGRGRARWAWPAGALKARGRREPSQGAAMRPRPRPRPRPQAGWPRPLAHLALLALLLSPAGGGAAHLAQVRGNSWMGAEPARLEPGEPRLGQVGQVTPEAPLEPRAPAQVGEGQVRPPPPAAHLAAPPAQPPLPALLLLLQLLQQPRRLRLLLPHLSAPGTPGHSWAHLDTPEIHLDTPEVHLDTPEIQLAHLGTAGYT
ncbi:transcription initiation factor TFIID subunit 4-like [Ammospiza caudacuta]|uniref:transcription initiation factor TFIID subunit 4-like n=1 Tax=Ammospiza caudacuta TaxID=2857398 RepID=UPI0027382930|nr:transcription initiation factor TFIID subunit 4-like [Ammospiza caudacuta]